MNWTTKEDQFLRDNYYGMTDKELSERLNRTIYSIRSRRVKLGIVSRDLPWTDEERQYVTDHPDVSPAELSVILCRSIDAIKSQQCYRNRAKLEDWSIPYRSDCIMPEVEPFIHRPFPRDWRPSYKLAPISPELIETVNRRRDVVGTYRSAK